MNTTTAGESGTPQQQQRNHNSAVGEEINISSSISTSIKAEQNQAAECVTNAVAASQQQQHKLKNYSDQVKEEEDSDTGVGVETTAASSSTSSAFNKKLLLCRRFKDSGGILRNFNSLPLFVYATSPSTHATSADGVGVAKEAAAAAAAASIVNGDKNDSYNLALCTINKNGIEAVVGAIDCLPLGGSSSHHHTMLTGAATSGSSGGGQLPSSGAPTVAVVGSGGVSYPHHLNINHHHHLLGHHSPYSNNYPLHHSSSHHHIHSDQTKSLQELQHEVGALLEFRDLVIETFPDLKHKMASMSSSSSAVAIGGSSVTIASVSGTNTLTGGGGGGMSHSSLASRREWEPGIRIKRKLSQKEPSTSIAATQAAAAAGSSGASSGAAVATAAGELSSSSLTRSRSNSHSGKKEPKSGETNNGSVVQDSGFSTETSSSKEGHSASSTNGAMTGNIASNRLSCPESDDELLNLLDVIHRKSNRLREEMEHLQNYERQNLHGGANSSTSNNNEPSTTAGGNIAAALTKSSSGSGSSTVSGGLTPKTFREHVERLNKEDIKQLRKERDRLLDKLAEMEAETLTGRIKAAKMNDQVEELISVKKDLEGQLKLAMAQKLELSSRVQQLQSQQSKSSSSQSDSSSQRNFLTSATTVLSTGSGLSQLESTTTINTSGSTAPSQNRSRLNNTFQPVVLEQQQDEIHHFAFHQSAGSDNHKQQLQLQQQQLQLLGHLDGIVSSPGGRNTKCRLTDSKRFTAILLETSVIELQRHLLTLTVQNQVLMQKLDQAGKSKHHLAKRLDKSKEDVEDLRFQLEEKNIELEGTKAQLRVLESRIHSHTPSSSSATTNSYLHSQNDYETNRSSASTTLMLSRRGLSGSGNDSHYSDMMRSSTPTSQTHQHQMPPPPNATQISTPSMKAMVHLPMDEIQHHSSSTESAHDHELHHHDVLPQSIVSRLMSTSFGGVSPFEQNRLSPRAGQQSTEKKFNVGASATASSKPSKIPLPGSKAATYFSGKPPSGRPSTAGRSPPSAHNSSAISNASSKSSLSRSTGNLLYSKSPNSLKRADSAQSIRKELVHNSNSSFGTNNSSRSSTSSSIPLATTPYGTNAVAASSKLSSATTPSPRVLQNSPLPKLKRESLTSRVRHLDSLSRVHHHNNHNNTTTCSPNSSPISNASDASNISVTNTAASPPATAGNYAMTSSTPKTSTIAAQLNSALRKDLQITSSSYSHGAQHFPRRATGGGGAGTTTSSTTISGNSNGRRHSNSATASSSGVGARMTARTNNLEQNGGHEQHTNSSGAANGGANASDSDSGKVRTLKSTFLGWLKI